MAFSFSYNVKYKFINFVLYNCLNVFLKVPRKITLRVVFTPTPRDVTVGTGAVFTIAAVTSHSAVTSQASSLSAVNSTGKHIAAV